MKKYNYLEFTGTNPWYLVDKNNLTNISYGLNLIYNSSYFHLWRFGTASASAGGALNYQFWTFSSTRARPWGYGAIHAVYDNIPVKRSIAANYIDLRQFVLNGELAGTTAIVVPENILTNFTIPDTVDDFFLQFDSNPKPSSSNSNTDKESKSDSKSKSNSKSS
jgi:hypothetical protein